MTRINHERPVLRFLDNKNREDDRASREKPVNDLVSDPRDANTRPDLPPEMESIVCKLEDILVKIYQGRIAKLQLEKIDSSGKINPATRKHAQRLRRIKLGSDSELALATLTHELLPHMITPPCDANQIFLDWEDWWHRKLSRDGKNADAIFDVLQQHLTNVIQEIVDNQKRNSPRK